MNTLEVNANTLAVLYEQSPTSFDGITLEDKMLKYNGEEVDSFFYQFKIIFAANQFSITHLTFIGIDKEFEVMVIKVQFQSLVQQEWNTQK